MSQADIELLRAGYKALSRKDFERTFRDIHPNFVLTTPPGGINSGTYRGREECQAYSEELLVALETWSVVPEKFFERGDQIVVFVKTRARPKGSSAEIEIRNGHLWTIREGTPLSMRMFPKPEKPSKPPGCRSRGYRLSPRWIWTAPPRFSSGLA